MNPLVPINDIEHELTFYFTTRYPDGSNLPIERQEWDFSCKIELTRSELERFTFGKRRLNSLKHGISPITLFYKPEPAYKITNLDRLLKDMFRYPNLKDSSDRLTVLHQAYNHMMRLILIKEIPARYKPIIRSCPYILNNKRIVEVRGVWSVSFDIHIISLIEQKYGTDWMWWKFLKYATEESGSTKYDEYIDQMYKKALRDAAKDF